MSRFLWTLGVLGLVAQMAWAAEASPIDRETVDRWSAPYRGWHYWPDPIIPAEPKIPGHEAFRQHGRALRLPTARTGRTRGT